MGNYNKTWKQIHQSIALHDTAVTLVLIHWSYHSVALSHQVILPIDLADSKLRNWISTVKWIILQILKLLCPVDSMYTSVSRVHNSSPKCRIYLSVNWIIIGSGNGLSPVRHQAITWTNDGLLSIGLHFQWNLNRNSIIFIQEKSFKNVVCQNGGHFVQTEMS